MVTSIAKKCGIKFERIPIFEKLLLSMVPKQQCFHLLEHAWFYLLITDPTRCKVPCYFHSYIGHNESRKHIQCQVHIFKHEIKYFNIAYKVIYAKPNHLYIDMAKGLTFVRLICYKYQVYLPIANIMKNDFLQNTIY